MGTSNWQNIPFCVDVLMKIAPTRVLDVGVGFGRWGAIVREFCDVWYGRIFKDDWKIEIHGIEGFERNISDYHRSFYSQIHLGDANQLIPALPGPWSVVIFGDVLEHFTKEAAREHLRTCLEKSEYVLVNIPLGENWEQGEAYGNVYERHLSSWDADDFLEFGLVRQALFRDYIGRPFGSFVLSTNDPKQLRQSLFSRVVAGPDQAVVEIKNGEIDRLLRAAEEQNVELAYIKQHSTYRMGTRLRAGAAWNAARWLKNRNDRVVGVRALSDRSPQSQGGEVWLLRAEPNAGQAPVPWDFVETDNFWTRQPVRERPYGQCLVTERGRARVPVDADPRLEFLSHQWSGKVEVKFRGRTEIIDLYSPQSRTVTVFPGRVPMVSQPAPQGAAYSAAGASAGAATLDGFPDGSSVLAPDPDEALSGTPMPAIVDPRGRTQHEEEWIAGMKRAKARMIAVHCPRWLGVSSSTRGLFEHLYPVPATKAENPFAISDQELEHHADVLAATGVKHFVFSGGDKYQLRLVELIREMVPDARCDLFWHGSYVQFSEDYTWEIMRLWIDAAQAGVVYSIATTKAGQERFFRSLGVRSTVLLNLVKGEIRQPPDLIDPAQELHVGVWLSGQTFRKNPHAMLSALTMVPNVRLHASGVDPRAREVIEYLGLPVEFAQEKQLGHDDLMAAIRKTHATLYVTFAECCPMLPLESLAQGVPCLTGPNSHLFQDNAYLFERLVVPFPDRAEVIADYLTRAVADREQIVREYAAYHPTYEERCRRSVDEFMKM